jgi:stage V sporulation protein S
MRVSSTSDPSALGGAIAHVIRRDHKAEISVIGAGALNQAIKGVAIAIEFLEPDGIDIAVVPGFRDVMIGDRESTALYLRILPRQSAFPPDLADVILAQLRAHPELRDFTDSLYASTLATLIIDSERDS